MIREVDLVSYLPLFMAEYPEIAVTLEAENPEFVLVWNAQNRVLYNEFIATADEYGISRFEKILKILPSSEDTLESRRSKVQARWFNAIPYTMKTFIAKLISLCGENNFVLVKDFDYYRIYLQTYLELFGQVEELENIINTMLPANIVVDSQNSIPNCGAEGNAYAAGGIISVETFFITNDENGYHVIAGAALFGGGITDGEYYFLTNDSEETMPISGDAAFRGGAIDTQTFFTTNDEQQDLTIPGSAKSAGGAVNTATVIITNDFNETFNIEGNNEIASGIVATEIMGSENL